MRMGQEVALVLFMATLTISGFHSQSAKTVPCVAFSIAAAVTSYPGDSICVFPCHQHREIRHMPFHHSHTNSYHRHSLAQIKAHLGILDCYTLHLGSAVTNRYIPEAVQTLLYLEISLNIYKSSELNIIQLQFFGMTQRILGCIFI